MYLTLMEDNLFDRFFQTYGNTFTGQQEERWKELRQRLEAYYDTLPRHPDPEVVLNDPGWEKIRQVAEKFCSSFYLNPFRESCPGR